MVTDGWQIGAVRDCAIGLNGLWAMAHSLVRVFAEWGCGPRFVESKMFEVGGIGCTKGLLIPDFRTHSEAWFKMAGRVRRTRLGRARGCLGSGPPGGRWRRPSP